MEGSPVLNVENVNGKKGKFPFTVTDKDNLPQPHTRHHKHKHRHSKTRGTSKMKSVYRCCFCEKTSRSKSSHLVHLMHIHIHTNGNNSTPLKVPFSNIADIFTCKIERNPKAHVIKEKVPTEKDEVKNEQIEARLTPTKNPKLPKSVTRSKVSDMLKKKRATVNLVDCKQ